MNRGKNNFGFTLIELIIVIAIIGVLGTVVTGAVNSARGKAKIAKVRQELFQISNGIKMLALDTGKIPSSGTTKIKESECVCNGSCDGSSNELYVDTPTAGLSDTDGHYPGWTGPYMNKIYPDPWGSSYIFDSDYQCTTQVGCEGYSGKTVSVVHSAGPNKSAINAYDSDDIVRVFCSE